MDTARAKLLQDSLLSSSWPFVLGRGDWPIVRLDDGLSVGFDVKDYAHIDHGYAPTCKRAKG
jgi:hypothetical protein